MILRFTAAVATLAAALSAQAAAEAPGISAVTPQGRTVTVTAVNPNVVRVTNTAPGETVLPSRATVAEAWSPDGATVTRGTDATVSLLTCGSTSAGIVATIDTSTGTLTISAPAPGSTRPTNTVTDSGLRTTSDGERRLVLATDSRGSMYGAGERGHSLNLRGDTLVMYNRQNYGYTAGEKRISQMNITMPLFVSTDGFALLFDDYAAAVMTLGRDSITYTTESSAPVSYYYIAGVRSLADVTSNLSGLTGRQMMPPLWTLGYITSKYGYHDRAETLGVVDTLKRAGYPLDGIVLDLYWYGKEQDMGRLAWDPDQWPDAKGMLDSLRSRGVNTVTISQPYILRNGRGLDNYRELADKGLMVKDIDGRPREVKIWVGEGGMFDVSNDSTRAWLERRYHELSELGVAGWWGDLGEPEVHPDSSYHANGLTTRLYHNQYGNDWSEIIYRMNRRYYPGRRMMTMMRGGTTGLQRYNVFPWSTDVSRSWGGLQPQVTIMLGAGLSGLAYMGHDVGGFAIDPGHPVDPELYVRWLQLGTFSPMLRTHAQADAEPYHYPEHEATIKKFINMRYRYLPYNYTMAADNARFGLPMVRPLNFADPAGSEQQRLNTAAADSLTDEYLWGNDLLVAPVMTQGATSRSVYFPAGSTWVDINRPATRYSGGLTATVAAPLDELPMFARGGAMIATAAGPFDSTADFDPSRLTLNWYPVSGESSTTRIYTDNLSDPDPMATGSFRELTVTSGMADGRLEATVTSQGTYPGAPAAIHITLAIHGLDKAPQSVTVDGCNADFTTRTGADGGIVAVVNLDFTPGRKASVTVVAGK